MVTPWEIASFRSASRPITGKTRATVQSKTLPDDMKEGKQLTNKQTRKKERTKRYQRMEAMLPNLAPALNKQTKQTKHHLMMDG